MPGLHPVQAARHNPPWNFFIFVNIYFLTVNRVFIKIVTMMIRKPLFIIFCALLSLASIAQDAPPANPPAGNNEMNTLFGKGSGTIKIPVGYFIEANGGFTRFGHKNVFLPGISMGVILNHHWTIGWTGNFIGNPMGVHFRNIYYDSASAKMHGANLIGGYGGLLLEYTLFPKSRVHVAFPLMIGGGYMFYSRQQHFNDSTFSNHDWHHNVISEDHFFVVEPGIKVECNLVRTLRLNLGVSYRYSPDLRLKNTPKDLINQFTVKLGLRFGKF